MKVCIVSVYDSMNSGSFWQAYALGYILKKMGHEVFYYKRVKKGGASSSTVIQVKQVLHYLKKMKIQEAKEYVKQVKEFRKQIHTFKIINQHNQVYNDIDYFVLGSDTIWNLDSSYFKKNKTIFWGDIFSNKKVFSYAGSIANTIKDKFAPVDDYRESIERWADISVRDTYTKRVFSDFTDREITLVCDPTLLLSKEDYLTFNQKRECGYIFLYLFDQLDEMQKIELRQFADARKLKIICGTPRGGRDISDEFVINSPKTFMEHMLGADYIITDTYHGTVFSVNFNKNFVSIDRKKNKVNEFLSTVGLENRLIKGNENLEKYLLQDINFKKVNRCVEDIRIESKRYLQRNLCLP